MSHTVRGRQFDSSHSAGLNADLDNQVVTSAGGVVKRRATFGVLEVDGVLGVDRQ